MSLSSGNWARVRDCKLTKHELVHLQKVGFPCSICYTFRMKFSTKVRLHINSTTTVSRLHGCWCLSPEGRAPTLIASWWNCCPLSDLGHYGNKMKGSIVWFALQSSSCCIRKKNWVLLIFSWSVIKFFCSDIHYWLLWIRFWFKNDNFFIGLDFYLKPLLGHFYLFIHFLFSYQPNIKYVPSFNSYWSS